VFVGINAYLNLWTGRQVSENVYAAKGGYLVEKPLAENTDQLTANLAKVSAFAEAAGLQSTLIVPPSAGYMSEDRLPRALRLYEDDAMIDTVAAAEGISVVDVREPFNASHRQLFYRTDHHWTAEGAYLAYTYLSAALGFDPLSADAFTKEVCEGFYGTTYSRSALWLTEPDTLELWDHGDQVTVTFSDKAGEFGSLFFREHLQQPDQYPVYLDGNHGLTTIQNHSCQNGKELIVVKDSFANSLLPLLTPHYEVIKVVDLRHYKQPVSELAAGESTQVLFVYSLDSMVNDTNIQWLR